MKLQELISCLPDVSACRMAGNPEIQRVAEDSRRVQPGDLFVARAGTKASGADYATAAIAAGAVAIVAAEPLTVPNHVAFVQVANAHAALALLAHQIHGNPTGAMKLLGVTGTNGKTTITYLLRAIFHAAGHRCGLIGTVQIDDGATVVESQMTTPAPLALAELFARMRANGVPYAIMETSSHALHQDRVAGMDFAVAMFTNLTGDHLDYHITMDHYAAAKALLFERLAPGATAIINADDPWAPRMVRDCPARIVRYAIDTPADWSATISSMTSVGTDLEVRGPDGLHFHFASPLVGRHNVYNSLCAMAAADAVGISLPAIRTGLAGMAGPPGRLQPVVPPNTERRALRAQVFVDYAHTHDALENVLQALRPLTRRQLICVFGCGGDRDTTKRPKMAAVAEKLADRIIVTSDNPRTEDPQAILQMILTGFSAAGRAKLLVEPDRRAAIATAIAQAQPGDVVLIAGKGHENYQILGTTKHHFDDVEEATTALAAQIT